ncbi:hypothetical protein FM104_10410 [Microbacterium esteraromaticum]|uniref:Uncharacterized protein n=1 Tax=Microbacterium esteraromaticum TaxID=57043 RepID=A0A1R4K4P2_9MICO|nr:hypothetical protein [Microbacterium esteraromaticum]SJN39239.1 hypothetical protein FM104_10410 [Microbacterium esteraromaticum]
MDAEIARFRWRTWAIGGGLLTVAGLLIFSPLSWLAPLLAVASAVVFAVGIGRGGSVVGTTPLGRVALITVAVLIAFVAPGLEQLAVASMFLSYRGNIHPEVILVVSGVLLLLLAIIGIALASIAGVRIGRAGVVPRPWAWLPLPLLLGGVVASLLKAAITSVSALSWMAAFSQEYAVLSMVQIGGTVMLGLVALGLGAREYFRAPDAAPRVPAEAAHPHGARPGTPLMARSEVATARFRWIAWAIGGALLIISGLLLLPQLDDVSREAGLGPGILSVVAAAVFAIGPTHGASITRRRPAGTVAILVCAVLLAAAPAPIERALGDLMFAGLFGTDPGVATIKSIIIGFVAVGLLTALVAAVSVGRAGVLPRLWAWVLLVFMSGSVLIAAAKIVAVGAGLYIWDSPFSAEWSELFGDIQVAGAVIVGIAVVVFSVVERSRAVAPASEPSLVH